MSCNVQAQKTSVPLYFVEICVDYYSNSTTLILHCWVGRGFILLLAKKDSSCWSLSKGTGCDEKGLFGRCVVLTDRRKGAVGK